MTFLGYFNLTSYVLKQLLHEFNRIPSGVQYRHKASILCGIYKTHARFKELIGLRQIALQEAK